MQLQLMLSSFFTNNLNQILIIFSLSAYEVRKTFKVSDTFPKRCVNEEKEANIKAKNSSFLMTWC